jgi:D-lactate dehydrogenase
VRRGPAYTELALYAQVMPDGSLALVNHLGIALGDDPETMLARLDAGPSRKPTSTQPSTAGRMTIAMQHVRDVDSDSPARFNADPRCLFEAQAAQAS